MSITLKMIAPKSPIGNFPPLAKKAAPVAGHNAVDKKVLVEKFEQTNATIQI